MNSTKLTSYILLGIGAAILLIALAWALANGLSGGTLVLAVAIACILAIPLIGYGIYTLNKGIGESADEKQIAKQRKILNAVQSQGKVEMRQLVFDLNVTREEAQQLVRDLIGKQLFSGYVDWSTGTLYSVEAAKLKDGVCPKCGGKIELAGKGIAKCPYCGSEVFLS